MKKILGITAVLISTLGYCQEHTTKVYNVHYGIKDLVPIEIIVEKQNKIYIYETSNGIRDLTPSKILETSGNNLNIYNPSSVIKETRPYKAYEDFIKN